MKEKLVKGAGGWYYAKEDKADSKLYNHFLNAFDADHSSDLQTNSFQVAGDDIPAWDDVEYPEERMEYRNGGNVEIEVEILRPVKTKKH